MFHPEFVDRLRELGLDTSLYENCPRKSVHIMKNEEKIVNEFNLEPVKWAEHCFWVDEPGEIQKKYYDSVFVQDAGSVVPVLALDVREENSVLDLCAAPGSKTLHLVRKAQHVIASDSHKERIKRLNYNLKKFHITNCTVMQADGRNLRLNPSDRVMVDAPCSGEGMVGKIHKVMKVWSLKRIKRLARIQRKLVLNGFSLLKSGGILVYSTCTFAPEENENVIDYLLRKQENADLEEISLNIQHAPGLTSWREKEYSPALRKTLRIYPFHNGTNGFFVARIRKSFY